MRFVGLVWELLKSIRNTHQCKTQRPPPKTGKYNQKKKYPLKTNSPPCCIADSKRPQQPPRPGISRGYRASPINHPQLVGIHNSTPWGASPAFSPIWTLQHTFLRSSRNSWVLHRCKTEQVNVVWVLWMTMGIFNKDISSLFLISSVCHTISFQFSAIHTFSSCKLESVYCK